MKNTIAKTIWTISVFIWLAGLVMAVLIFFVNPFTMLITAPVVSSLYFVSKHMEDKINWTK